jgi:glycosyltransferase involved in cell wall biosynthesis
LNANPFVTVGVPVYNGEAYLREALNSILNQTFRDFELIISDNASTDRTQEICEAYAAREPRIEYLRNSRNVGAAENYNIVFRAARGRYFKWAAHDDTCAPEFLELCISELERDESVVLCYPTTMIVDQAGGHLGEYTREIEYMGATPAQRFRDWMYRRPGGECNAVFGVMRTATLAQTPLIGKYMASDVILLGEMVLRGKVRKIPETLFFRRDHPQTSGRAQSGADEILVWFDTSKKGKIHMPRWRWLLEYVRAIGRVPMGMRDKARCLVAVMRRFFRARRKLRRELSGAIKKLFRKRAWVA